MDAGVCRISDHDDVGLGSWFLMDGRLSDRFSVGIFCVSACAVPADSNPWATVKESLCSLHSMCWSFDRNKCTYTHTDTHTHTQRER